MSKKIASAFTLLLAASGSSFGAMPLITDDTGTQGAGGNQLEVAYGEDKENNPSTGITDKALMPSLTYTRGVTETIDVFVGIGWVENKYGTPGVDSTKGSSNPSIGAKWRFLETERKTSLALKAVYGHPVSEEKQNKDLGDGEASWDGTLILSQELGFGSAHANIGMGKVGRAVSDPDGDVETTHVSVAPMLDLGETAKLVFDFGQDTSKPKNGTKVTSVYWEVGAIYAPSKSVDLALGFIQAKEKDSDIKTDSITGGVTWRF